MPIQLTVYRNSFQDITPKDAMVFVSKQKSLAQGYVG